MTFSLKCHNSHVPELVSKITLKSKSSTQRNKLDQDAVKLLKTKCHLENLSFNLDLFKFVTISKPNKKTDVT